MKRVGIYAISVCVGVGLLIFAFDPEDQWFFAIVGLLGGLAVPVIDTIILDYDRIRIAGMAIRAIRRRVRISAAYLIRIEIDGHYLLVPSERWQHHQPVGGVYKYFESAKASLDSFNWSPDPLVQRDDVSQRDLRLTVAGERLALFVKWFVSEKDREVGVWREFREELIQSSILPAVAFAAPDFRFVKRNYSKLRKPPENFKGYELLIADVFELLLTPEQVDVLRSLRDNPHPGVIWATQEQIRARGAVAGANQRVRIADHAELLLES